MALNGGNEPRSAAAPDAGAAEPTVEQLVGNIVDTTFATRDSDADGVLLAKDFASNTDASTGSKLFERLDLDGSGSLAWSEYRDRLLEMYYFADLDSDGVLQRAEARRGLARRFDGFDANTDGQLGIDEFVEGVGELLPAGLRFGSDPELEKGLGKIQNALGGGELALAPLAPESVGPFVADAGEHPDEAFEGDLVAPVEDELHEGGGVLDVRLLEETQSARDDEGNAALRQLDIQGGRCSDGILAKRLVKIPDPKQQNGIRVVLLHPSILLHERGFRTRHGSPVNQATRNDAPPWAPYRPSA